MLFSWRINESGPGGPVSARWLFGRESLFSLIARALSQPVLPRLPDDNIDPETIRVMISKRSHGNVRLQNKLFYTKKDVDERFERIRGISFVD